MFGNGSTGCDPKSDMQGVIARPNQEPKPLVAAAERIPASSIVYPSYEKVTMVPIYEKRTTKRTPQ